MFMYMWRLSRCRYLGGALFELFYMKSLYLAKEIEKIFHERFKGVKYV